MKKILLLSFGVAFLMLQSCNDNHGKTANINEIELISPQQVFDAIYNEDSLQLVDVRTNDEYLVSHLKGAQNICIEGNDFEKKVKLLDKNKPVYVYCKKGSQSVIAAEKLKKLGFTMVYDLDGGINSWKENEMETENKLNPDL